MLREVDIFVLLFRGKIDLLLQEHAVEGLVDLRVQQNTSYNVSSAWWFEQINTSFKLPYQTTKHVPIYNSALQKIMPCTNFPKRTSRTKIEPVRESREWQKSKAGALIGCISALTRMEKPPFAKNSLSNWKKTDWKKSLPAERTKCLGHILQLI